MTEIPADIEAAATRFHVSRESMAGLAAYVSALIKWQAHINLIGPATASDVWRRHVLDGLQLLAFMPGPETPRTVVDLGSGGGVPGLVLAIARPGWKVHLVESNNKKAAFLREAARLSGAKPGIHAERIEAVAQKGLGPVDYVTARALAPLPELLELAFPLLKNTHGVFHKGQDVDIELTAATKCWIIESRKHMSLVDPKSTVLEILAVRRRDGIDSETD